MCGQCGLVLGEPGQVGHLLKEMEAAMIHRGPDSTGFALYSEPPTDDRVILRARFDDAPRADATLQQVVDAVRGLGVELVTEPELLPGEADAVFARLVLRYGCPTDAVLQATEAVPGVYVHSMGRRLEIIKDVGDAHLVAERHRISEFVGTHGLAHSRLATESVVNVEYSHPFWARPFLDVAIAHNGQLTNYYRMRRLMMQRGFAFLTNNDSELIAVYVAEQLSRGVALEDALRRSIDELDGVFSYLLSTAEGIGCATDPLAIKPICVTEHHGMVAMATEERAIRRIIDAEIDTYYPPERTVKVWPLAQPPEAA
jgi:methylamine---glutamate N-methyltransferase subunit A